MYLKGETQVELRDVAFTPHYGLDFHRGQLIGKPADTIHFGGRTTAFDSQILRQWDKSLTSDSASV
jgi:hypothetical protein